jgi:hypothetical protein
MAFPVLSDDRLGLFVGLVVDTHRGMIIEDFPSSSPACQDETMDVFGTDATKHLPLELSIYIRDNMFPSFTLFFLFPSGGSRKAPSPYL